MADAQPSASRGTSLALTPEDAALLDRLPVALRAENEIPSEERARARERAATLVANALGRELSAGRLRVSPLGAGWSKDLDVYLQDPVAPERVERLGLVSLDRLSRGGRGGRWALLAEGQVLAGLDVHVGEAAERSQVETVLARCRRRGRVSVREILELRVLQRNGEVLGGPNSILTGAARAEAALGGTELAPWLDGSAEMPPIQLPTGLPARFKSRAARLTKKPIVVAISGVDGSGKSTLADALANELRAAGLDVSRVWARPGMEMRLVKVLAKLLKRILRKGTGSAVRKVARGEATAETRPSSRRGVIGWTWALLVTLSYIAKVRGALMRSRGVVVFDRHLLDALVTLDFVYEGVDLRLQRALVKALIPKAMVTIYLSITADEATARKKSVVFGEYAVRKQLEHYERRRAEVKGLVELDATAPVHELKVRALKTLA